LCPPHPRTAGVTAATADFEAVFKDKVGVTWADREARGPVFTPHTKIETSIYIKYGANPCVPVLLGGRLWRRLPQNLRVPVGRRKGADCARRGMFG
jgi:hypothetical protein